MAFTTRNFTINGTLYGWTSLEVQGPSGMLFPGISSINWEIDPDGNARYGTGKNPVGFVRGQNKYTSSITILQSEYFELVKSIGKGYSDVPTEWAIAFQERDEGPVKTVKLSGVRLGKQAGDYSQGNDALEVKIDLYVQRITIDGVEP